MTAGNILKLAPIDENPGEWAAGSKIALMFSPINDDPVQDNLSPIGS
jgi:hypothetical protein